MIEIRNFRKEYRDFDLEEIRGEAGEEADGAEAM